MGVTTVLQLLPFTPSLGRENGGNAQNTFRARRAWESAELVFSS